MPSRAEEAHFGFDFFFFDESQLLSSNPFRSAEHSLQWRAAVESPVNETEKNLRASHSLARPRMDSSQILNPPFKSPAITPSAIDYREPPHSRKSVVRSVHLMDLPRGWEF